MSLLLDVTIRVTLIVLCGLAATTMLRKQSASVRHWVLAAALVCAALLPLLASVVPSWSLPFQMQAAATVSGTSRLNPAPTTATAPTTVEPNSTHVESALANADPEAGSLASPKRDERKGGSWFSPLSIWLAGALISVGILAIGLGRLAWLVSRAERVSDGPWVSAAANIAGAYGIRRTIAILQSTHPALLVTWGVIRPQIMLPRGAASWPADRIEVVLCHELAHIRRNDWALQIGAELLRAIYWFNPLLWVACRRLREESERACDDAVLTHGVEGREYAWQLLNVARAFARHGHTWSPAPAIASRSTLEQRITAMLDGRINRAPITRSTSLAAVAALLALTLPIAAAQTGPATLSGIVFDPGGTPAPNVRLVLDHLRSEAVHEIRTDENGRFEFPRVPAGDYRLDVWGTEQSEQLSFTGANRPGGGVVRIPLGVAITKLGEPITLSAGQHMQRDVTLELGPEYVNETVMIETSGEPVPRRPRNFPDNWGCLAHNLGFCGPPSLLDEFESDLQRTGRIPANLRLPRQLKRPEFEYPLGLRGSGRQGQVSLDARIGTDGFVGNTLVVNASHPDFAEAVEEGLRQARWEPARFGGVLVEVPLRVVVDFTVR